MNENRTAYMTFGMCLGMSIGCLDRIDRIAYKCEVIEV